MYVFQALEALQMIKRYNYQMLLTDLKMPGIDGLELIKKTKEGVSGNQGNNGYRLCNC